MKAGYGYDVSEADLRAIGAGRVFVDNTPERPKRDDLMAFLNPGDTLLLLYKRHLGGAPNADDVWWSRIEAKGVTIQIVRPEKPPARMGRPPERTGWSADTARAIHAVWTTPGSLAGRLRHVEKLAGEPVGRGLLNGRFGNPDNPKPFDEAAYR